MRIQLWGDLLLSVACLYPLVRIFARAGLKRWLASLVLVPFFGLVLVGFILSLSDWYLNQPGRS